MIRLIIAIAFLWSCSLTAQDNFSVDLVALWQIEEIDHAKEAKKYEVLANENSSAEFYFNAACYWNLAGELDQAFRCLNQAAQDGFRFYDWMENETDLSSLHNDKAWDDVLSKVKTNFKNYSQESLSSNNYK